VRWGGEGEGWDVDASVGEMVELTGHGGALGRVSFNGAMALIGCGEKGTMETDFPTEVDSSGVIS